MEPLNLTKRERVVLRFVKRGEHGEISDPPYSREIMEAVIRMLETKGLVKPIITKSGVGGHLTPQGHLLFADNPKLRNKLSPEIIRWAIGLFVTSIAAVASVIACLK